MSLPLPIAGPKGGWLLGNYRAWRSDILGFYTNCARYGDIVHVRVLNRDAALVSHPDGVEEMLATRSRHFVKNFAQRMLAPWLGNGLLLSEGTFWLRQRRLMQPAFHRDRVASYANDMVQLTQRMMDSWKDGETRDIHQEMTRLTLAIAGKTLFSADVTDSASEVGAALHVMMLDFDRRFRHFLSAPLWVPTPANLRTRRSVRALRKIMYGIIRQRRASGEKKNDLLSRLLEAQDEDDGGRMTDDQVRDEVMTLLLAGHDTTANALSWTWYLLAGHPTAAARLAEEVDAVLGGRLPTTDDVPRLAYCERVIQESLRLYPPVYGFGREAVEDTAILGRCVPKGWSAVCCQWVIQRDPRWFADPERFDPDRWKDGLAQRLPRYAYFPFGGGPRLCIGQSFALMEAVLVMATLAQRYHFTLEPGCVVVPAPYVTLRPRDGIPAPIKRRTTTTHDHAGSSKVPKELPPQRAG